MAKKNNNSTKLTTLAKPCGVEERLRRLCERSDEESFIPITETFIENVSLELIEWADQPDSFILGDFYNPRGYSDQRLLNWVNKYPVFAAAYEYAKTVIGDRREKKRIFETNCAFTLSDYNKKWKQKEDLLHQRKLEIAAKKDQNQPTTINIIQQKAEECPEVPPAPSEIEIHVNQPGDNSQT